MEWHWIENLSIFHHLPRSLGDLLRHEDKNLLKAGLPGLVIETKASTSRSAIEKDIDPAISRSQQNFSLLITDYLHTLPVYSSENEQTDALLAHWRKILLEQPQRLAESHMDSWNNERSRSFWHERLKCYKTDCGITSDYFPTTIDDWERSAGSVVPPPEFLKAMQSKQWQDLVIRQRIHTLDLYIMGKTDHPY